MRTPDGRVDDGGPAVTGPELARLAAVFRTSREFDASPLYRRLLPVAAEHPEVLRIAARGRPGQQPTYLLLAAVHHLLLDGAEHPLRAHFESAAGSRPVAGDFVDFCRTHAEQLTGIVSRRLVQTNSVRRALALRIGLARVAALTGEPVHLVEVGASAGLNLLLDRYAFAVGDVRLDGPDSPVRIVAESRGPVRLRDTGPPPEIRSRQGVDLNPLDPADPEDRQWLRALVWPDQPERRRLLDAALELAAADPPPVRALDVTAGPAPLGLPAGEVRVLFHSAVRMHVPPELVDRFDAGVDALAAGGPAYLVTMDPTWPERDAILRVREPDGRTHDVAGVEGHLSWVEPLPGGTTTGDRRE